MHTTKDGQAFIASLLEQTLVREGLDRAFLAIK
jgi:hypothetical protein